MHIDDVYDKALANNEASPYLWIKIVYRDKIRDIMLSLYFKELFEQMITDARSIALYILLKV